MIEKTSTLFNSSESDYGQGYKDHLLAQYQLYVESMEKISDRRQNANNYFITINTVLISFIGILLQAKILTTFTWVMPLVAIVGIIICMIFWFLLRSYKQLNTGKFKVIHEIEKKLPIAIYDYEWTSLGEGKKCSVYFPFSHIEMGIPWVFGIIYIILGVVFLACRWG